jgi:hypothetical protein
MEYRILIVSEDATERNRYAETLITLPPAPNVSYQITTVGSVAAAQLQATRQRMDLVIVALCQHDDGLQLSSRLKELFPDIRILLLCEQGVTKAQLKTARLIRSGVAEDTIDPQSLRAIVADLLGTSQYTQEIPPPKPTVLPETPIQKPKVLTADVLQPFFEPFLEELRRQTKAQIAIVLDKTGRILGQSGEEQGLDVVAIAAIIAKNTMESLNLRTILHDTSTVHLSVHGGKTYDIYSANVESSRCLALFFNKEMSNPKLGLVWLVIQRSLEKFTRLQ